MKITFLIGLPGSGKSTLGNKLAQSADSIFLDDIKNTKEVQEAFHNGKDLIIADVNFCVNSIRIQAENIIKGMVDCEFEYIYFENDPQKCLKNVESRMTRGDYRKVNEAIKLYSQQYIIPENVAVREVYQEK